MVGAHLQTAGRVVLDQGAVKAVIEQGRSLLPVGIKAVEGQFLRGEAVACVDEARQTISGRLGQLSCRRSTTNYGHILRKN
jgi:glutamate 5-kinase